MEKKLSVRLVVIFIFSLFWINTFFFSKSGLISYFKLKRELVIEQVKIAKLEKKICLHKIEIDDWQKYDFGLERMARNDMKMCLPDESVYLYY